MDRREREEVVLCCPILRLLSACWNNGVKNERKRGWRNARKRLNKDAHLGNKEINDDNEC